MSSFQSIPSSILAYYIVPFIDSPSDLLSLRAASKWLKTILHESEVAEDIWKYFLKRDFQFSLKIDNPDSKVHYLKTLKVSSSQLHREGSIFGYSASEGVLTTNSSFNSWKNWERARRRYFQGCLVINKRKMNGPYFLRAADCWQQIERWCEMPQSGVVGRRIMFTLIKGTTYRGGRFVDNDLPGTHAFRSIFSFYDGQEQVVLPNDNPSSISLIGLFGGYVVYDKSVCMQLMPSSSEGSRLRSSHVGIARNGFDQRRFIYLNCNDGMIYLSTRSFTDDIPLSKPSENDKYDAGLVWMEEFARKLSREEIEIGNIVPDEPSEALLWYPTPQCRSQTPTLTSLPIVSRKVTKGIEVIASSNFDPLVKDIISYSIRIRLLANGDEGYMTSSERGFETCQLFSRHWVIKDDDNEENVDGNGVVGFYPLLAEKSHRVDFQSYHTIREGLIVSDPTFRYQSCASSTCTSFKGRIRFVPGSFDSPTGPSFFVDLAPFALRSNAEIKF